MPIYEFYCPDCNMIFSFLSRAVNPAGRPACPKCRRRRLRRLVSRFSVTGKAPETPPADDPPVDEARMEKAMETLASEAGNINEDDPRQAAGLMRKLSRLTGLEFGQSMEEAIRRMEAGEDPDQIESDMGDMLEGDEEPFVLPDQPKTPTSRVRPPPARDETLYEM